MVLQPHHRCRGARPTGLLMRTRRMAAALVVAMLMVAACGGESNGPKQGVHDAGGKDAFNASLVAENVIADVTVAPAKVGDVLVHMEFAPRGAEVWISARDDNRVMIYDTKTREKVGEVAAEAPSGIFFTARAHQTGL